MSAIDPGAPDSGASKIDGLRRYTTRIKAIVHSHNHSKGPIVLSDDVLSCQIGKNIKGAGKANIAVVARNSYLNMIYPNDYLNIYFDVGDGNGWVRTFLGLIDRVEENYTVDETGAPSTLYHIIATDFQKVFEKTNIYFNEHLFNRPDVEGEDYNAFNIGGVALQTRGLRVQGGPADMVLNMTLLQIGFGAQWKLPDSYPVRLEDRFNSQRSQYAQQHLLESVSRLMEPEGAERLRTIIRDRGLSAFSQDTEGEVTTALQSTAGNDINSSNAEERVNAAIRSAGLDRSDVMDGELTQLQTASDVGSMARILSDARVRQQLFGSGLRSDDQSIAQAAISQYVTFEAAASRTHNIIDIMNVLDFVERRAIDGYAFDLSIWNQQGPLVNIIRSVSNEVVNELFFDLRPMSTPVLGSEDTSVHLKAGADWDRTHDEIGGNRADLTNVSNGIRYMPAIVMREYPFSTVNRIDAAGVSVSVGNNDGQTGNLGIIYFGGVFSNRPNEPGRHLVAVPVLNLEERAQGLQGPDRTFKHLDVAVISETEIRSTQLGRSDQDHYNLLEMWTEGFSGSDLRYYMYDFLPIITPVHIQRHGLRTRTITTRFAMFPPALASNLRQVTPPPPEEAATESATRAADALFTSETASRELIPPLSAHPSVSFRNTGPQRYGYRPRSGEYIFHNGIDIYGDGPAVPYPTQGMGNSPGPVDVVAIADGNIIASIAQGTVNGAGKYGNVIVIHHPQFTGPSGKPVFSVYAHLAHREPTTGNTDASTNLRDTANRTYLGIGGRSFTPIPVTKGTKIGSVGVTQGNTDTPGPGRAAITCGPHAVFQTARAHLHFEIDYRFPPKNTRDTPRLPLTMPDPFPGVNSNNTDPVAWFAANGGGNLVALLGALGEVPSDLVDQGDAIDHDDPDPPPSRIDAGNPTDETQAVTQAANSTGATRGVIDSIDIRQQIARWALLQDHWYQHNLEYLSGQIDMRGAPEIRVGYRLDIKERRTSFYVESVQHSWQFPDELQTSLQVTRGQPNNPYPVYVLPSSEGFNTPRTGRRSASRLAHFFIIPDPIAIRRAISLRENTNGNNVEHERASANFFNIMDDRRFFRTFGFGEEFRGLVLPSSQEFDDLASNLAELSSTLGLSEEEAAAILRESGFEITEGGIVRTDRESLTSENPRLSGSPEAGTAVDSGIVIPSGAA